MATPVTEHDYPPLDSQGVHTFIESQGGTVTGDLQTDFRNALFIIVAPGGKANDYSIDDLWARHIMTNVAADGNAAPGNPAAGGRGGGNRGFVGLRPIMYYIKAYLKNPNNANPFPGSTPSARWGTLPTRYRQESIWLDGYVNDLNPLVVADTRVESLTFANDGQYMYQLSSIDDEMTSFEMSVPWDLSTAVETGTKASGGVVPRGFGMAADGSHYWVHMTFTDTFDVYATQTDYEVSPSDSKTSSATDTEMGSTDTQDGVGTFAEDGMSFYVLVEQASTSYMSKVSVSTAFDLDAITGYELVQVAPEITQLTSSLDCLQISPDEMYIMYSKQSSIMLGTMSTPGDISTLTFDDTEKKSIHTQGTMSTMAMSEDGSMMIAANNTVGGHEVRFLTWDGQPTKNVMPADPTGYTKTKTWDDGGANDLNALVAVHASARLSHIDFGQDGTFLITYDRTNQDAASFELSTPYDISTAAQVGVHHQFIDAQASSIRYDSIGHAYSFLRGNSDQFDCTRIPADPYYTTASDVAIATLQDTEVGSSGAPGGAACMDERNRYIYWLVIQPGSGDLWLTSTPIDEFKLTGDIDEIDLGEQTTLDVETEFSGADAHVSAMMVVNDGMNIMYLHSDENLYYGTMTTAHDVSTLTWSGSTIDLSGETGLYTGFTIKEDGSVIYFVDDTLAAPQILEYS